MTAPRYTLTVTARVDPPVPDAAALARRVLDPDTIVMSSHGQDADADDVHRASWTVLAGNVDPDAIPDALTATHRALADAVRAAGHRFELEELSAATTEHLAMLARVRERAQLVGVEEFREMLAPPGRDRLSRSQFFELAGRDGFPKPVRRGRWTRHQAEEFAARDRPGRGRPSRAAGE